MAIDMTATGDVSTVVDAYNIAADYQLRPMLYYDAIATVRPWAQAHRGQAVYFTFWDDLDPATSPLTENQDVTPVDMSDSQVSVTLYEYGNAIKTSAKLRGTGFLGYDASARNIITENAGRSLNVLARTPLAAGTNVRYSGQATSRATVIPTDTLSAADVRYVTAKLRGNNAKAWRNNYYWGFVHPDCSLDLRTETGAAAWVEPVNYSAADRRWVGQIRAFEGVWWIEDSEAPIVADAGSSTTTTDVYQTIVVGQEALAKAYSMNESAERPQLRPTPVTDTLRRFNGVGWYWLGGYGRYRDAALYRIESASSIGDNS